MKDFLNSLLVLVSTSFNNCIKLNMVTTEILTSRQFNVYLTYCLLARWLLELCILILYYFIYSFFLCTSISASHVMAFKIKDHKCVTIIFLCNACYLGYLFITGVLNTCSEYLPITVLSRA